MRAPTASLPSERPRDDELDRGREDDHPEHQDEHDQRPGQRLVEAAAGGRRAAGCSPSMTSMESEPVDDGAGGAQDVAGRLHVERDGLAGDQFAVDLASATRCPTPACIIAII